MEWEAGQGGDGSALPQCGGGTCCPGRGTDFLLLKGKMSVPQTKLCSVVCRAGRGISKGLLWDSLGSCTSCVCELRQVPSSAKWGVISGSRTKQGHG